MEVRLKPDVQAKLEQLAHCREMLGRRFDDLESGRVKPIDGEEAYRHLMEKTETQRQRHCPA
jgi:hypothetical protein